MRELEVRDGGEEYGGKGMSWWVSDGSGGEGGRESVGGDSMFNLFLPLNWPVLPAKSRLVVYLSAFYGTTPVWCLKSD